MDFKVARQAMVDCQLATNNVISPPVIKAMQTIPREDFLPENKRKYAYLDEDILVGEGRYLIEPMIIARMIQAVEPSEKDIALDVGSGSGYSAAILSYLVETVIAVESKTGLRQHAGKIWGKLDIRNIADISGENTKEINANAPYDIILINGAVHSIPQSYAEMLKKDSGRMVCVLRENPKAAGKAVLITNPSNAGISTVSLFDANIPYLEEFAPENTFSF